MITKIANETGHTRFPIVNEEFKLVGIVTSRNHQYERRRSIR